MSVIEQPTIRYLQLTKPRYCFAYIFFCLFWKPGESLRDFYKRTNMYWQMAAYEHTQHTGKVRFHFSNFHHWSASISSLIKRVACNPVHPTAGAPQRRFWSRRNSIQGTETDTWRGNCVFFSGMKQRIFGAVAYIGSLVHYYFQLAVLEAEQKAEEEASASTSSKRDTKKPKQKSARR